MNQLWVDLTDLRNWRGHMTGIQRVVYNVARQYDADQKARFFIYDTGSGFHEVDFQSILPAKVKGESETVAQPATRSALKQIGRAHV